MVCERCGKEFFDDWRKDKQQRKLPMRFCSRACANARSHSESTKKKIKDSCVAHLESIGKKLHLEVSYCKNCGKQLNLYSKHSTGYCHSCAPHFRVWTEEAREKQRINSINNPNCGGNHTSFSIVYKGIKLDSRYELEVAKSLDENNIRWERPKPLLYKRDDGKDHRYYPDFYLPDFNIYLDPKNDFLLNHANPHTGLYDSEKIRRVMEANNVRIILLDKDNLQWSKIKALAGLV